MKKLFVPFVWLVEKLGVLLRLIWNGGSRAATLLKSSADGLERKQNRWVGTGFLGVALTAVAIIVGVSKSDIERLNQTIDTSFEKMEKRDILFSSLAYTDFIDSNDERLAKQLYGCAIKQKTILYSIKESIQLHKELNDDIGDLSIDSIAIRYSEVNQIDRLLIDEFCSIQTNNISPLIIASELCIYGGNMTADRKIQLPEVYLFVNRSKKLSFIRGDGKSFVRFANQMDEAVHARDMKQIRKIIKNSGEETIRCEEIIVEECNITYDMLIGLFMRIMTKQNL